MLARLASRISLLFIVVVAASGISYAQFTGNIQGTVQDPSGAAVAQAKLVLQNSATQVSATTTSDSSGNYKFLSLAPGAYTITAEAPNFQKSQVNITLLTEQNLNVPVTLKVGRSRRQSTSRRKRRW